MMVLNALPIAVEKMKASKKRRMPSKQNWRSSKQRRRRSKKKPKKLRSKHAMQIHWEGGLRRQRVRTVHVGGSVAPTMGHSATLDAARKVRTLQNLEASLCHCLGVATTSSRKSRRRLLIPIIVPASSHAGWLMMARPA
jgi:hypothetical protein